MVSLEHLAKKYGADKLDLGYINLYDEILSSVRNDFSKVLEIGVETGKSHRMWLEYFPNANIYGIDVFNEQDRSNYVEEFKVLQRGNPYLDRSVLFKGNQSNKEDLQRFISEHGNDFEMIIDDGGHSMEQMQMSLNYLWDSLKGGGLYIIEDLHTCSNQWESLYGYEIIKDGDTLTTDLLDSLSKKDDKITETNYISSEMLNKIRDELDWCETKIGVESYKNYTWPTMLNFMRKKI